MPSNRVKWRWAKWIELSMLTAVLAGTVYVFIAAITLRPPGSEKTPAGFRQETSTYTEMRDKVEIAVTVLLPPDLRADERVPVLMRTTRYWRRQQMGWGTRMLAALHLIHRSSLVDEEGAYFNQRRFAVILVGPQRRMWSRRDSRMGVLERPTDE